MTEAHQLLQTATNTVTESDCQAWRLLADEYSQRELAFMFEVSVSTIARHQNGDCGHEHIQQ